MKRIKKIFALTLALTLAMGIAACGGGTTSTTAAAGETTVAEDTKVAGETTAAQETTVAADSAGTKNLVFWDKSEYVKEYNTMMEAQVKKFGEENGVTVEYVIVPPNDLKQKLMAAIEAKQVPDLIMGDDMLLAQFAALDALRFTDDVLESMDQTESAKILSMLSGKNYMVPLAFLAPGCYYRKDLFEAAGVDTPPTTWNELKEAATKINDPASGLYALGLPMGASGGGDAESFMRTVILSHGGIPVNENGEVTINSPETLAALNYVKSLFDDGLVSPDVITWDDSANNSAYLAGTAGVIFNAGSVWSTMKNENPDLLAKSIIIPYPAGPSGKSFVPGGSNSLAIMKDGANAETAAEFLKYYFADKEYYNSMIEAMGGMWQPVLNGMEDTDFWKMDENKGWLANSKSIVRNFYPAPADERANLTFSNQLCVKAVQNIVVNGMDPQAALDNLEVEFKKIYE